MFSISTVWNVRKHEKIEEMVDELRGLGFSTIELTCGLSMGEIRRIAELVEEGRVKVGSLHNYCPAPVPAGVWRVRHPLLPLSSRDEKLRKWAVRQTIRTLETARAVKAPAVVIHLGNVSMRPLSPKLITLAENGEIGSKKYEKIKNKLEAKREAKKGPYLEQAAKSLKQIADQAEELGVRLGVENRYYPEEIPSLDEIGLLFEECSSPAVGYWHDVGHAQVKENLDWEDQSEYLKRYGDRLIGMHIHDVIVTRDHKAPLQGEVDFTGLRGYLRRDITRVLEIHPTATGEEIEKALAYLEGLVRED